MYSGKYTTGKITTCIVVSKRKFEKEKVMLMFYLPHV